MLFNLKLILIKAIAFFLFTISLNFNNQAFAATTSLTCPKNMALIQCGNFRIGSDDKYQEEKSVNNVKVTDFLYRLLSGNQR